MTTITVRDEVATILRIQAATYAQATFALEGTAKEFYAEVSQELYNLYAQYAEAVVEQPKPVAFKEGDYVRLTGDLWDEEPPHPKGTVVQIVRVESYANGDGTQHAYAYFLDDGGSEWYVVTEGNPDFDNYGGELVEVDPEIRVGDTVRVKHEYSYDGVNPKGTEFVVTEIVPSTFEHGVFGTNDPATGLTSRFYVAGDPAGRGVWEQFVEKVHQ
jgi:hypothetical protein